MTIEDEGHALRKRLGRRIEEQSAEISKIQSAILRVISMRIDVDRSSDTTAFASLVNDVLEAVNERKTDEQIVQFFTAPKDCMWSSMACVVVEYFRADRRLKAGINLAAVRRRLRDFTDPEIVDKFEMSHMTLGEMGRDELIGLICLLMKSRKLVAN